MKEELIDEIAEVINSAQGPIAEYIEMKVFEGYFKMAIGACALALGFILVLFLAYALVKAK